MTGYLRSIVADKNIWLIQLDPFFPEPAEQTSNIKTLRRRNDTASGLASMLDDVLNNQGDIRFISRDPELAKRTAGLPLPPFEPQQISERLYTEETLPDLKHGLNGGHQMNAANTLAIVGCPALARDFSDLGTGVIWINRDGDNADLQQELAARANVIPVTVTNHLFTILRRAMNDNRRTRDDAYALAMG